MCWLSYKFYQFIWEGLGWPFIFSLAGHLDYEPECEWLLRWLTLDSLNEVTCEDCTKFAETCRIMALDETSEDFVDDAWDAWEGSSESSYHPSDVEVEWLDDPVDPMAILRILLPSA